MVLGWKKKYLRSPSKKKAQFVATKSAVCWKRKRSYFYTAFNIPRKPAPIKGSRAVGILPLKTPHFSPVFHPKNRKKTPHFPVPQTPHFRPFFGCFSAKFRVNFTPFFALSFTPNFALSFPFFFSFYPFQASRRRLSVFGKVLGYKLRMFFVVDLEQGE